MSMKATEVVVSSSATLRATVDFPEPEPPAIPMMSGFNIDVSYVTPNWNALCPTGYRLKLAANPGRGYPMNGRSIPQSVLIAGLLACSGFKQGTNTTAQPGPTVVQVDNQGFLDMTVYAVRSTQRYRLGTATGNAKTNFNIPTVIMSGITPVRFVADPIGGNRASVSEEITVAPGDTVVLTIPPV